MSTNNDSTSLTPPAPPSEGVKESTGEILFEVFCAAIFLGMIGLVFTNAFLRYVFRSSFPPSEEWARFLFIYITFIGAIEAFYRHKHIAVDMFVNMLKGSSRKVVDIFASLCIMGAFVLLFVGGVQLVLQTYDTNSVATNINMALINGTLPLMALAALIMHIKDFVVLLRTPAAKLSVNETVAEQAVRDAQREITAENSSTKAP